MATTAEGATAAGDPGVRGLYHGAGREGPKGNLPPPRGSQVPRPVVVLCLRHACDVRATEGRRKGRPTPPHHHHPPEGECGKGGGEKRPPPPPRTTERSLGWCALRAPPFTRTVAPPPGPRARAGSRAGQRSARPGAPPPATPWRRGRKVQSRTAPLCLWQSWGVDPPSRAPRERAPVPHAVVGPLAACP